MSKSAIVVGAGIVGLATTRALAARGYRVTVFERTRPAIGASIRNFGMIWPIGQPDGELYERAMLSCGIWQDTCAEAAIWSDPVGSLHLAYCKEEMDVLRELAAVYRHRKYQLLDSSEAIARSGAVVREGLAGGLYSPDELIVDPRQAIDRIPAWLKERFGVQFHFGKAITDIAYPAVFSGRESWEADEIFVCSGADFETLYPELYAQTPITKCKLQMMRLAAQPGDWRIGPALCGGLSLVHYQAFRAAPSLELLRKKFEEEYPEYIRWGIHVMVSQNEGGELTVGDSHEYGHTHDPFDKEFINRMILDYLRRFARFKDEQVIQTWNGIYPKLTDGRTNLVVHPEEGVTVINGLGGAGMTLSFGFCEQLVSQANLSLH